MRFSYETVMAITALVKGFGRVLLEAVTTLELPPKDTGFPGIGIDHWRKNE